MMSVELFGASFVGIAVGRLSSILSFVLCCVGCFEHAETSSGQASPAVEVESAPKPASAEPESEPASAEPASAEPESEPASAEPEPEPEPPFADREQVRVDELLAAIEAELPAVAESEAVRADYEAFLAQFELDDRESLYLDYVRVKVAFEATRAGGLWGLRWAVTNEQPNSEKIWAQWQSLELEGAGEELPPITATAECDELSALFAFVAQRIGLERSSQVGLFWPTGNHVVAVWTIDAKSERPVRVVIPTSQIFLSSDESLGTNGFDPWTQKNIFDYRRQDAAAKLELPATLAKHFVLALRELGGRSQAQLQVLRNEREHRQLHAPTPG